MTSQSVDLGRVAYDVVEEYREGQRESLGRIGIVSPDIALNVSAGQT
jgi:hypothetical protein